MTISEPDGVAHSHLTGLTSKIGVLICVLTNVGTVLWLSIFSSLVADYRQQKSGEGATIDALGPVVLSGLLVIASGSGLLLLFMRLSSGGRRLTAGMKGGNFATAFCLIVAFAVAVYLRTFMDVDWRIYDPLLSLPTVISIFSCLAIMLVPNVWLSHCAHSGKHVLP